MSTARAATATTAGCRSRCPSVCPACGSRAIRALGMGTERLEREVRERFPALRLIRMDRDTTRSRDAYFDIYDTLPPPRGRLPHRHADGRQGMGPRQRAPRRHRQRRHVAALSRLPQRRADLLAAHPGGGASGARRRAGAGGAADVQPRALRGPSRHHARLSRVRARRDPRAQGAAIPAVRTPLRLHVHASRRRTRPRSRSAGRPSELSDTLGIGAGLDVLGPTPAFLHRLRGEYRWQITVRGTDIERAFPHLPRARGWSIDVDPGP